MISFVKKTTDSPSPAEADDNRFEQIRKTAAEKRKKSDSGGEQRRARQATEDDRVI